MPAAQRLERVADFHGSLPDRGREARGDVLAVGFILATPAEVNLPAMPGG
jgi:hypothetical protein